MTYCLILQPLVIVFQFGVFRCKNVSVIALYGLKPGYCSYILQLAERQVDILEMLSLGTISVYPAPPMKTSSCLMQSAAGTQTGSPRCRLFSVDVFLLF